LSLIEVALLLCIGSVVLAVFVPTFLRRVRTNKINEASELLQEMSDRTAAYYATSWDDGQRHCLPPDAGPTPAAPTVDLSSVDFFASDQAGHATWEALGFQPGRAIRYSYSFATSDHGCGLTDNEERETITFRAEGDLDGDLVRSVFERSATIEGDLLKPADVLHVHKRIE
jgi:hypothetical protein